MKKHTHTNMEKKIQPFVPVPAFHQADEISRISKQPPLVYAQGEAVLLPGCHDSKKVIIMQRATQRRSSV